MQALEELKKIFFAKPRSIDRLGSDIFVEMKLYKSAKKHTPIYINKMLFERLTGLKNLGWQEMSDAIEELFSSTIEEEYSNGESIATVYADKQADPLNISLSGNLGSGRAYYAGSVFNIKGEKTILAISDDHKHSDGMLEMERSIWETVVANSFQNDLSNGLSPVLAILDMNETCQPYWREKPVKKSKIIRIDENGELDRVSHDFYNKRQYSQADLDILTEKFGILEAEKITHRILHGGWSAGNISPNAHMIDFDTVATVKGRGALYSYTKWYPHNRFGYEYLGSLCILNSIADSNQTPLNKGDLEEKLVLTRDNHISELFVKLMGFANYQEISQKYKDELDEVIQLFNSLSKKIYKKKDGESCKEENSNFIHAFDLSLFLRIFPINQISNKYSNEELSSIICSDGIIEDCFTDDNDQATDIELEYIDGVNKFIGEDYILSLQDYNMLKMALAYFIKKYTEIFEHILAEEALDINEIILNAYIINQDRKYLFPYYTPSFYIAEKDLNPEVKNKIISKVIQASQIDIVKNDYVTDIIIYNEGCIYKRLKTDGSYQLEIELFDKISLGKKPLIIIDDKEHHSMIVEDIIIITGFNMEEILENISVQYSLEAPTIKIIDKDIEITFSDIVTIQEYT